MLHNPQRPSPPAGRLSRAAPPAQHQPLPGGRAALRVRSLAWASLDSASSPAHARFPQPRRRGSQRCERLLCRADAFSNLSASLEAAWAKVQYVDRLTPENMKEPLRDVRRALLEADVSLPVVRRFVARVEAAATGAAVTKGVRPDQQLVKLVNDELVTLMGGARGGEAPLALPPLRAASADAPRTPPSVILMAGLQGVGKTTACGKLALYLSETGRKPLLVAADVYRPAAIDQLLKLAKQVGVEAFTLAGSTSPADIAAAGVAEACARGCDVVIVDTAGRTQADAAMMAELQAVKAAVAPDETLLVVDAMTGQAAAGLAAAFNDAVGITGAVLTKMDGDARGGAALSVREVSGAPIKFVGTGEKMGALEPFYPERMASRILGMGDVVSLVEKAAKAVADDEAERMAARIKAAQFDFNDFLKQAEMLQNMGPMSSLMRMMPGMKLSDRQLEEAEKSFKISQSLVRSMTPEEREKPELIAESYSRRRRVARGAGRSDADVVALVGVFAAMRAKVQDMSRLMKIAGGNVGQMSAEEMQSLVGAKKRVSKGMVRRYKNPALRITASAEMDKARAAVAASIDVEASAEAARQAAADREREPAKV